MPIENKCLSLDVVYQALEEQNGCNHHKTSHVANRKRGACDFFSTELTVLSDGKCNDLLCRQ